MGWLEVLIISPDKSYDRGEQSPEDSPFSVPFVKITESHVDTDTVKERGETESKVLKKHRKT